MKVWGLWWGGSSYAYPHHDAAEEFRSIAAAEDEFSRRYNTFDSFYPGVESDTEMRLYVLHPEDERWGGDPLCDWTLKIGPNGGIQRERC